MEFFPHRTLLWRCWQITIWWWWRVGDRNVVSRFGLKDRCCEWEARGTQDEIEYIYTWSRHNRKQANCFWTSGPIAGDRCFTVSLTIEASHIVRCCVYCIGGRISRFTWTGYWAMRYRVECSFPVLTNCSAVDEMKGRDQYYRWHLQVSERNYVRSRSASIGND